MAARQRNSAVEYLGAGERRIFGEQPDEGWWAVIEDGSVHGGQGHRLELGGDPVAREYRARADVVQTFVGRHIRSRSGRDEHREFGAGIGG